MSRSQFKGIFCKKALLNVSKQNKNLKKKQFIVQNKNHKILPEHLNYTALIYNGKKTIPLLIIDQMIGYKFGEFINTRVVYKYIKKKKKNKMSQTTISTSLRLVKEKNWKSEWISNQQDYSKLFIFDNAVRKYIQLVCTTKRINCHKIIFKKEANRIGIYVYIFDYIWKKKKKRRFKSTVISQPKERLLQINQSLLNTYLTKYALMINLPFEVKLFIIKPRFKDFHLQHLFFNVLQKLRKLKVFSPFLNILSTAIYTQSAFLLNSFLIKNLKQNQRHKQFLKKVNFILQKLLSAYSTFYGFKIQFKGKINGAARARKFNIFGGVLPKTTLKNSIVYDCQIIKTTAGICSLKTWLFFKEVNYKKKKKQLHLKQFKNKKPYKKRKNVISKK